MGFQDRDYMRRKQEWRARLEEHQRKVRAQNLRSKQRTAVHALTYSGDMKLFMFACLCLVAVPFAAAKLGAAGPLDVPSFPAVAVPEAPGAGVYYFNPTINGAKRPVTKLTIYNNSRNRASHMLSFRTQGTRERIIDAFVPAGETVTIPLPIGRYDLYWASGEKWYGDKKLFGWRTEERKHIGPFVVERNHTHFIKMDGGLDGNMRSVPASY